jgi:hypothetical protein
MDAIDRIFALSPDIGYVALHHAGRLLSRRRSERAVDEHSAKSARCGSPLVDPDLLSLLRRRDNIDCGGALIRHGNFHQLVMAVADGQASVCFELWADPLGYAEAIRRICEEELS